MNSRKYQFDPCHYQTQLAPLLTKLDQLERISESKLLALLKKYPKDNQGLFTKSDLISGFIHLKHDLGLRQDVQAFMEMVKKKPVRTQSGITPVTVLTKPFPCPGKCIFCPNDIRMPKSYLSDEPGAQRATRNKFDPYLQTYDRLLAFAKNGHNTDKVEVIILGGTWSFYPEDYQIWFIKRVFDAINDYGLGIDRTTQVQAGSDFLDLEKSQDIDGEVFDRTYNQVVSKKLVTDTGGKLLNEWEKATWEELELVHKANEHSRCRCVGLVIETRPDKISYDEVIRIRRLGCTKTQIGVQSLMDEVLTKNHRGHDVAATRRAFRLLRQAGFKIHAHWMANLYGSTPRLDVEDFKKLFSDPDFRPDELKIYPCSLIQTAELMQYYKKGLWRPYTQSELLGVVTNCITSTPEYCRLTRIIRDIPSTDIVVGNKKTNFRQIAEDTLHKKETPSVDIRSREIKAGFVDPNTLALDVISYQTSVSTEHFLQFVTPENKIVGFLRLSLPSIQPFTSELLDSAIIREVHVYGVAAKLGEHSSNRAQHLGLGTKLITKAKELAKLADFKKIAVISAVGTREYYKKQGFKRGELYQHCQLT